MMVLYLAHTWKHWRQGSNSDVFDHRNSDVCDDDGTVSGTHLETLAAGEEL